MRNQGKFDIDIEVLQSLLQAGLSEKEIQQLIASQQQKHKSQSTNPVQSQPQPISPPTFPQYPLLRHQSSNFSTKSTQTFTWQQYLKLQQEEARKILHQQEQEEKERQKEREKKMEMQKQRRKIRQRQRQEEDAMLEHMKEQMEIQEDFMNLRIREAKSEEAKMVEKWENELAKEKMKVQQEKKEEEELMRLSLERHRSVPVQPTFTEIDQLEFLTAEEKQWFYRSSHKPPQIKNQIPNYEVQNNLTLFDPFRQDIDPPRKIHKQLSLQPQSNPNSATFNLSSAYNQSPIRIPKSTHSTFNPFSSSSSSSSKPNSFPHSLFSPLSLSYTTRSNKQLQHELQLLLRGPRVKVQKYYGIVDQVCYSIGANMPNINYIFNVRNNAGGADKMIQFIVENGEVKFQVNARQVKAVVCCEREGLLLIVFQDALRFFKKNQQIGWDRLSHLFMSPPLKSQILLSSLYSKKQSLLLSTPSLSQILPKLRSICRKPLKQTTSMRQHINELDIRIIESEFTEEKFRRFFEDFRGRDCVKGDQMEFGIGSVLFGTGVDVVGVFQLAEVIRKLFNPFQIQDIWRTIINLNPDTIQSHLHQKKPLKDLIPQLLQQQKSTKQKAQPQNTIRVPIIKITPTGYFPSGWTYDVRNRLTRHFRDFDYQFMKVEVTDDDFRRSELFQCKGKDGFRGDLEGMMGRVRVFGRQWVPLGWTQSQLKSKSMWYTLQKSQSKIIPRQKLISFLGNFQKFNKNPALKAARMGQNLSNGQGVILPPVNYSCQEDDKPPNSNLMYTDGIGMISADLVQKIQKDLNTTANIFQVRYRGCKGMLVVNRALGKQTVIVRESMRKFQCQDQDACKYLDILAENSYGPGYLNRQIIILLHANSIPQSTFIQIQQQFITNELKNKYLYQNFSTTKSSSHHNPSPNSLKSQVPIFQLQSIGQIMNKVIKIRPELIADEPTLRGILIEKHHAMFQKLMNKSQIRIQKSARLLGIIDQYGVLRENQVYCHVTKPDDEKFTVTGKAMLTKNPCMHPADIRVVTCLSLQQVGHRLQQTLTIQNPFTQLTNCIIFPKSGKIPLTSQISGSDLDGDQFYICWDERLVPPVTRLPKVLDAIQVRERVWGGVGYEHMLGFFCQFIFNYQLGRLANCHLIHADRMGVDCQVCQRLCEEYSKALDYPKKGYEFHFDKTFAVKQYPHWMQKPQKQSYQSLSILGKLFNHSSQKYQTFKTNVTVLSCQNCYIQKFTHSNYTNKQILEAVKVVEEYQEDIQRVLRNNMFQRESELYGEKVAAKGRGRKDQLFYVRNHLQRKYFWRFFEGVGIKNPTQYYDNLRTAQIDFIQPAVQRKLILWYQISNASIQRKFKLTNQKIRNWISHLESLMKKQVSQLKIIGLTWFCLPYLTYLLVMQEFHQE